MKANRKEAQGEHGRGGQKREDIYRFKEIHISSLNG